MTLLLVFIDFPASFQMMNLAQSRESKVLVFLGPGDLLRAVCAALNSRNVESVLRGNICEIGLGLIELLKVTFWI